MFVKMSSSNSVLGKMSLKLVHNTSPTQTDEYNKELQ